MLYTEEYSVYCILQYTLYTVYTAQYTCILYTAVQSVCCILQYTAVKSVCCILQCTLHMSSVTLRGPDDIHHRLDHP
jgi:hypothetical protein